MKSKPKALILCDYWSPVVSANSACVREILNPLLAYFDVVILSADCPPENDWPDGVRFVSVGDIGIKRALSAAKGSVLSTLMVKVAYKPIAALNISRFPIRSREWGRRFERAAKHIIRECDVKLVVCVNYPAETLLAAEKLSPKFPGVRFVGWMLDATAVGMYRSGGIRKQLSSRSASALERRVLKKMDGMLFLSAAKGLAQRVHGEGNRKISFADPPFISSDKARFVWSATGRSVRILYAGTLARPDRDPCAFVKTLSPLCSDGFVELLFAGESSGLLDGLEESVKKLGMLSPEACNQVMRDADILLNIGNKDPFLVPSKLFKYMSMGKPIIHIKRGEEDSCLPYLKTYPLALVVDDSKPERLIRDVEEFITRLSSFHGFDIDLASILPKAIPEYTVSELLRLSSLH